MVLHCLWADFNDDPYIYILIINYRRNKIRYFSQLKTTRQIPSPAKTLKIKVCACVLLLYLFIYIYIKKKEKRAFITYICLYVYIYIYICIIVYLCAFWNKFKKSSFAKNFNIFYYLRIIIS